MVDNIPRWETVVVPCMVDSETQVWEGGVPGMVDNETGVREDSVT